MRALTLLMTALCLHAAAGTDSDFDGVEDRVDRCPQTPFSEMVAADGCPVRPNTVTYDIAVGGSYATGDYGTGQTVDSVSGDLVATLYAEHFFAGAAVSYYFEGAYDPSVANYDGGGISDTFLNAGYTFAPFDSIEVTPALQVKLSTAAEGLGTGENDYGASLLGVKRFEGFDLFLIGGYTVTGDTAAVTYQDVAYGSAGAAYTASSRFYASLSFDASQSYYEGDKPLEALSFYGSYAIYDTLFLRLQYAAGLSATAARHAGSVMIVKRF